MATQYESPRAVERTQTTETSSGMGIILGLIVAFGIIAILFFAFFDRTPDGPTTVSTKPAVTAPERTVPKTTNPPANTTVPATPSTK